MRDTGEWNEAPTPATQSLWLIRDVGVRLRLIVDYEVGGVRDGVQFIDRKPM